MCKIFKHNSLLNTIEVNKKVVDFLDITLDLRTAIYKPYKKPNSNLTYIHKQSNHPPSIKNLPKSINKRLSTNSKNETCPPPPYTETLKNNGYNTHLQFDKTCTDKNNEKNKTRKRKITWFNPPFNINVATNVAKIFLTLIDKHFPKNTKLSKIINRNTIKVSYSCLPNVKQTISNNNHRLLQLHRMKESTQDNKPCNRRQKKKPLAHLTANASLNALYIKQQLPLVRGFINYEKAFDSIEHFSIFEALRKINVNETYVKILENIYKELRSLQVTSIYLVMVAYAHKAGSGAY